MLTIKHWLLPVLLSEDLTMLELRHDLRVETIQLLQLMLVDLEVRSLNHNFQRFPNCILPPYDQHTRLHHTDSNFLRMVHHLQSQMY
jgi:hypothetical protein